MSEQSFFERLEPKKVWLGSVDELFGDKENNMQPVDLERHLKMQERRRLRRMTSENVVERVVTKTREHFAA